MEIEIIELSWCKRRAPDKKVKIINVGIIGYEQIHNHFCRMIVDYEDGTQKNLISRVLYNKMKDHWIIDGMHVAVKVL